jgi:hypothetical protein
MALKLEDIIERLERHRQRATYSAVAGVLKRHYRNIMDGQTKSFRNSWVVSKTTKLPTGYGPQDWHPELLTNENGVIETPTELKKWLAEHE